jgi:spermidine synthase
MGPRGQRAAIAACFIASGTAALLNEVVWLRLLGYAFGSTVHATTAVLATFLGGLAIGGIALGRFSDRFRRPLRAYAALEIAIATWCAATPLAFQALQPALYEARRALDLGGASWALLQLGLGALILLPPAVLMGMTLPLLGRWIASTGERAGVGVGRLYALNTWGGVAGTLAAGFWLVPALGLRGTSWMGAALQVAAGLAALGVDRSAASFAPSADVPGPEEATLEPQTGADRLVLLAATVAGAVAMVLEVAWTRALAPILSSSTYSFSAMLATFLVGIAGGAWAVARALRRMEPSAVAVGFVQACGGVAVLAVLPLFPLLPEAVVRIISRAGPSFGAALLVQFGGSVVLLIVPALLLGATLPLATAAWARREGRIGRDVGVVYGLNGVGAVAGAIVAGLVLVPKLGAQGTALLAGWVAVLSGVSVLGFAAMARARAVLWVAGIVQVAGLLTLAPTWDRRLMTAGAAVYAEQFSGAPDPADAFRKAALGRTVLFFEEGLHSTVAVRREGDRRSLSVNGKVDGSTHDSDMRTQLLLGHLPALLHPSPRRAFVVGLGTGVTAAALAAHPLQEILVAEIEPAVVRGAALFSEANRRVLDDPRVRVRIGDARNLLAAERGGFDVIVSEPSNPWIAGVGNLFTREFFDLARRRLAPGGVMVQWLHAYSMSIDDVRMIAATFRSAFPGATLWRASMADLLLVGTEAPVALDPVGLDRRIAAVPEVAADLRQALGDPSTLPWTLLLSEDGLRRFADGARLNTDDRPALEFSAPRALMGADVGKVLRAIRVFRTEEAPFAPGAKLALFETPAWRLHLARLFVEQGASDDAGEQLDRIGDPVALPFASRVERVRILQALDRARETAPELVALGEAAPKDEEVARLLSRALAPESPR